MPPRPEQLDMKRRLVGTGGWLKGEAREKATTITHSFEVEPSPTRMRQP